MNSGSYEKWETENFQGSTNGRYLSNELINRFETITLAYQAKYCESMKFYNI